MDQVEKSIKEKIEALGTPLSEWDLKIYRGVLTGFNKAFIITGEKKAELISKDSRSAEIIRPILRGRDIKRYSYQFADLYLICLFPSRNYDIENFPAIKNHLLSFGYERLEQSGKSINVYGERISSRKKTNNKWFETQDSISYWEDFYKQKIIYPNMTKFLPFLLDDEGFFTNQKCFILTGSNLHELIAFFNSKLFMFAFRNHFPELLGGTRELSKIFFERIRISPTIFQVLNGVEPLVNQVKKLRSENKISISLEETIDSLVFEAYNLSSQHREYILRRLR